MQATLKFILCTSYDFINGDGERVQGIKCQCFEPNSKTIVKVKTDHIIEAEFGDDLNVLVELNGRYINYIAA